jgi:hypothetical protein
MWKQLGEALAAIGVIVSLVVVAVEIRQNTNAIRGATVQAVSQQSMDLAMAGLDNEALRDVFEVAACVGSEGLSPQQRQLLGWFFASKLRADENRLRQMQLGTLERATFGQLSNNQAYRLPYFAEWWALRGSEWAPDFQALVVEEFLPLSEINGEASSAA